MPTDMRDRIQSVLFTRERWNTSSAIAWLRRHKLKVIKVDVTDRFLRFRQYDPQPDERYRTYTLDGGIEMIVCIARGPVTPPPAAR
jgi:hypothetical protein